MRTIEPEREPRPRGVEGTRGEPRVVPQLQAPAGRDQPGAEVPVHLRRRHPRARHLQLLLVRPEDREPGHRPDDAGRADAGQPDADEHPLQGAGEHRTSPRSSTCSRSTSPRSTTCQVRGAHPQPVQARRPGASRRRLRAQGAGRFLRSASAEEAYRKAGTPRPKPYTFGDGNADVGVADRRGQERVPVHPGGPLQAGLPDRLPRRRRQPHRQPHDAADRGRQDGSRPRRATWPAWS